MNIEPHNGKIIERGTNGQFLPGNRGGPRQSARQAHRQTAIGFDAPSRAMLYRTALVTGSRIGELQSLTPRSFNLNGDPPTITVEAAYSKRRRRDVQPIRTDPADTLRVWLNVQPVGRKAMGESATYSGHD